MQDDLASATWKDLRNVGFTSAFAKRLVRLRRSENWSVDQIWQLKKDGGLGLQACHFEPLKYANISDGGSKLDIASLCRKNQRVSSTSQFEIAY